LVQVHTMAFCHQCYCNALRPIQLLLSHGGSVPSDRVVHGMAMANVTCRKVQPCWITIKVSYPQVLVRDIHGAYDSKVQFVFLKSVESTNVAVCGIAATSGGSKGYAKPIMAHRRSSRANVATVGRACFSFDVSAIERLALLDMHPHRAHVTTSFEDSKLFEVVL